MCGNHSYNRRLPDASEIVHKLSLKCSHIDEAGLLPQAILGDEVSFLKYSQYIHRGLHTDWCKGALLLIPQQGCPLEGADSLAVCFVLDLPPSVAPMSKSHSTPTFLVLCSRVMR